jgi:hypothetical protein
MTQFFSQVCFCCEGYMQICVYVWENQVLISLEDSLPIPESVYMTVCMYLDKFCFHFFNCFMRFEFVVFSCADFVPGSCICQVSTLKQKRIKLNWIMNIGAGLFPNTSASLVSLPYVNLPLTLRRATGATSRLIGTASAFSRWLFVWHQRSELILLPRKNKIQSMLVGFVRRPFKRTFRFKRVKQCLQTLSIFHPYAVFALSRLSHSMLCAWSALNRRAAPRRAPSRLHAELLSLMNMAYDTWPCPPSDCLLQPADNCLPLLNGR